MIKVLVLSLCLFNLTAFASSLSLDIGGTEAVFNRFAIPSTDTNRISLPTKNSLTSYRVTGYYDLDNGNQLYFLLAPLATTYNFTAYRDFEFDDENFSAGMNTEVKYKFNSYRLGYLWRWNYSKLKLWGGVVGKIRDAKIEVSQGNTSKSYDNIGFVPLAAFGAEYFLTDYLSLYTQTDALAAAQGSAYDSQLEFRYHINNFSVSLGKRVLGGGADNNKVYNFAQFDTLYTRIGYHF